MITTSKRLNLRQLTLDDAAFVMSLFNDPDCIEHIGDKGIRSLEDAKQYLLEGPMAMYQQHGFGLWVVELKSDQTALGLCGLLKRDYLESPDIGFAFLPESRGQGYALEAARATMLHAKESNLLSVCAIVSPENNASISLLEALDMRFAGEIDTGDGRPTHLYQ